MQAQPEQDPAGTIELPENGLGAHVAWIAGPEWVSPDRSRPHPRVRHTVRGDSGDVTTERDRTAEDQRWIDDDIADHLADAGIPPPPPGVRWTLRRPAAITAGDFWAHVNRSLAQRCPQAREPREIHACLVPVVEELLSSPGVTPD